MLIDLLTDSGTGAMSTAQWGALMQGDEAMPAAARSTASATSCRTLTGFAHIIPTHQGRAAERILFHTDAEARRHRPEQHPLRHDARQHRGRRRGGARPGDPRRPRAVACVHPFKGNIDLAALERDCSTRDGDRIPLVMVTVTNNSGGGQPVSLENLRGVRALCDRYGMPFFLDACRFAENAWFIKQREAGQAHRTPRDIAREMFSLADGCTMSAKKDGLANIGGFLALNDDDWAERGAQPADPDRRLSDLRRPGRLRSRSDRARAGRGDRRSLSALPHPLDRVSGRQAAAAGMPIVQPAGGHAIYIDARALLPHIPPLPYPGIALVNALYSTAACAAWRSAR